MAGNVFQIASL